MSIRARGTTAVLVLSLITAAVFWRYETESSNTAAIQWQSDSQSLVLRTVPMRSRSDTDDAVQCFPTSIPAQAPTLATEQEPTSPSRAVAAGDPPTDEVAVMPDRFPVVSQTTREKPDTALSFVVPVPARGWKANKAHNDVIYTPPAIAQHSAPLPALVSVPDVEPAPAIELPPEHEIRQTRIQLRHYVLDGDSLARLAEHYLGSARHAPEIFAANRDLLARPDVLPLGIELRIPQIVAQAAAREDVFAAHDGL